jgi:hypothetical protein
MLIYDLNANPLNSNEWAFPLTECFHITSFALSIGTIMLVDLRLMGLALNRAKPAQLVKDTGIWTIVGLVIVIFSGLLIFSSDPIRYTYNAGFQWKMAALVVAILFNYTVHRKVAMSDISSVGTQKFVGALSVLLWVLVPFGGIWISFV